MQSSVHATKKYGLHQKNKGAKLDSFLSRKLVYAAAVEAVERPVPPAMLGVGDGDSLRLQNVSLNRELKMNT